MTIPPASAAGNFKPAPTRRDHGGPVSWRDFLNRPVALTIAGSDSCGGAGIQADLKTFMAFGVHGANAVTSITVQNTSGVRAAVNVPPEIVAAQIDAVMDDLPVSAAKTGMLATAQIMRAVAERLGARGVPRLVVDPVMVATSGARLMDEEAVGVLVDSIFPLAAVVTPNIEEASVLAGFDVDGPGAMEAAARGIVDLGARAVLVKGGHLTGDATDILFDGSRVVAVSSERIRGGRLHGTGCTLSAAIAAGLARGEHLEEAVRRAKTFVTAAIRGAEMARGAGALLDHIGAAGHDREGA
jgi:hydroxymethylpyrimidine/phosphomethylpyrimidine kinase